MSRRTLLFAALLAWTPASGPAEAGPAEVRAWIDRAKSHAGRHVTLQTFAFDRAARRAPRRAPGRARAFRLRASALRRADRPHAALASYAAAARASRPRGFAPMLSAGRLLQAEGDLEAATALFEAVAAAGMRAPGPAARATTYLIGICAAEGAAAREVVANLVEELARLRPDPARHLRALGRLGELHLAAGDMRRARRTLRAARRVYEDATDDPAAVRAWLDLALREALDR